jgi:hypothetical protein
MPGQQVGGARRRPRAALGRRRPGRCAVSGRHRASPIPLHGQSQKAAEACRHGKESRRADQPLRQRPSPACRLPARSSIHALCRHGTRTEPRNYSLLDTMRCAGDDGRTASVRIECSVGPAGCVSLDLTRRAWARGSAIVGRVVRCGPAPGLRLPPRPRTGCDGLAEPGRWPGGVSRSSGDYAAALPPTTDRRTGHVLAGPDLDVEDLVDENDTR